MSVHSQIRERRTALGWSQERLAAEVSRLEGLSKPLSWQTVQQWEKEPGGTAPKRARLTHVATALDTTIQELIGPTGAVDAPTETPHNDLTYTLRDWRLQASSRSQQVIDNLILLAQKNELREEDWLLIEQMAARMRKR